jgi:hypothetical protein
MSTSFEAFVWNDLHISMHTGSVRLMRGLYRVTTLHDERGRKDRAELTALDSPDQPIIRLTQVQFEMLDGTPYFERRS